MLDSPLGAFNILFERSTSFIFDKSREFLDADVGVMLVPWYPPIGTLG